MNALQKIAAGNKMDTLIEKLDTIKEKALSKRFGAEFQAKKDELLFGSNVEIIQNTVRKTYLPMIAEKYDPVPFNRNYSYYHRVRIARIKKWVTDKAEDPLDKLSNVYSALSGVECSVSLVYRRKKSETNVYFVIANQSEMIDPAVVDSYYHMFVSALTGNFPGVEIEEVNAIGSYEATEEDSITGEWFADDNCNAVAMITDIASESSEKFISQGIEKLLDGVVPSDDDSDYTLMLLAEPISKDQMQEDKIKYSNMYSGLSPFAEFQTSMSISEAKNTTTSVGGGSSLNIGGFASVFGLLGVNIGTSIQTNYGFSKSTSKTESELITSNRTNYRVKEALEIIQTHIKRVQQGEARGMWNFSAYVLADNYSVAQNVANMYRSLTEGENSYLESAAINIWNDNRPACKEAIDAIQSNLRAFSHPYFTLKCLNDVSVTTELEKKEKFSDIPLPIQRKIADSFDYPSYATGCACITGRELAMAMNMPRAAVSGLPVIECAPFGRDVISQKRYEEDGKSKQQFIRLGNIFHMQKEEVNKPVLLDAADLPEHVFVTGSTGAGKSTTIVRMLSEASKLKTEDGKNVTFMVIEPAKGEYKNDIGKMSPDAPVFYFGTNPREKMGNLLRINPFAFPVEQIHILEHLDRLIGIISVCWPLYAAMPAVLKRGMEEAYKACGWDLLQSVNRVRDDIFPTFQDVCTHIRKVIDQSDYSADNRSDYKGALVTRLESLTNGINGLIFSSDPIPDELLFEHNVIVDLSRVGSSETKALIMGILVMKLQEYRMSQHESANQKLRHVTVLEEAHNLLKRTSTEQHAESGNLLGKSVEMLSNSIAEMRTYGEAFVIADQAPGLLDMSVIRNTNTKIIMRLPDYSDRELVGKAANLNEDQIVEIAKLKPGVAAVYYNGWINPVLCLVKKPESKQERAPKKLPTSLPGKEKERIFEEALDMIVHRNIPEDVDSFIDRLKQAQYPGELIYQSACYCQELNEKKRNKLIPSILYMLFDPANPIRELSKEKQADRFGNRLLSELVPDANIALTEQQKETIVLNLLHEQERRFAGFSELYGRYGFYYNQKYGIGGIKL